MNKWIIAEGSQTVVLVDNGSQVGILIFADDLEQAQTNARLIVAVPDLLDACKDAKKAIYEAINKRKSNLSAVWHTLEAAITKAEPQQADEPERAG